MGRLRFGVAFAVTGKELDSRLRGNDEKKAGRDEKEWNRGFPGGGRKRRRGTGDNRL